MKMRDKGFKASTTASQIDLAHALLDLYTRHKREFTGVWMCQAAKDLPRLAQVLQEYAAQGVNPHLTAYWQPPMFPEEQESGWHGECVMCGKESELNYHGRCAACESIWNG